MPDGLGRPSLRFLLGGANKLLIPQEKPAKAPGGGWVLDFSAGFGCAGSFCFPSEKEIHGFSRAESFVRPMPAAMFPERRCSWWRGSRRG
jgi:hypothetical protein